MKYPKKRMMFYIDGFNLCFGSLRGKPYRWLDLEALCGQYVKRDAELCAVKYFTAKVKDRPDKPGQREQHANTCVRFAPCQRSRSSTDIS